MKRWWKRPRKLVLGSTVYLWSLQDRPLYRELRVIDLFRPGAAACIIGWHEGSERGGPGKPVILQEEPALLQRLLDLSFSPEEQAERRRFLERIGCPGGARKDL